MSSERETMVCGAVAAVEARQMELCTILQTVAWQPSNAGHLRMPHTLLGLFVEHLVTKNIGMLRNVPPPGVSGIQKPLPPITLNSKHWKVPHLSDQCSGRRSKVVDSLFTALSKVVPSLNAERS